MMLTEPRFQLTPRQEQIMDLMVDGCSSQQIALRLGISYQTVKNLLASRGKPWGIYARMGLYGSPSRAQAAVAYLGYRSLKARGMLEST